MRSLVTLTTDFGEGSPYVAQMKGVILSICREVDIVDISHAVRPQDIRHGALVLADATPRFPAGTIHVAVVDPGVGTSRRIVYAEMGEQQYIAPDNGLLSRLAEKEPPRRLISIEEPSHWLPGRSSTFHGRDIMAPVAARLAAGLAPEQLGPEQLGPALADFVKLEWPKPRPTPYEVHGEVLAIDSFGNAITNIEHAHVLALGQSGVLGVRCAGRQVRGIVHAYGSALNGEVVALFDSQGRLEIAVVGGSAARELGLELGEQVIVSAT
jgi:S-adenosylmethionine hydrolase